MCIRDRCSSRAKRARSLSIPSIYLRLSCNLRLYKRMISYLVFFKGRDADVMTAAFQEFSAKKLNREKKPSIRKALAAAKDKAKQLNAARDKVKKMDRGREI